MGDMFRYQAPVYLDFQDEDVLNIIDDEFFNYYREDEEEPKNVCGRNEDKQEDYNYDDTHQSHLRRASSVNDIHSLRNGKVNQLTESLSLLNLNNNTDTNQTRLISTENIRPVEYVTLAEQVRLFHAKTPDRFKSKSKPILNAKYQPVHTTKPQSPYLTTKMRSRPVHILTSEEREIKEAEELRKYQFKAQELNKKIFQAPCTGVTAEKKPNTQFEPFKLTEIKKKIEPRLEEYKFHAAPLQKKMFETVIGVPKKQPTSTTVAKTPTFMKESKLRSKHLAINSESGKLELRDDAHHGIQIHKSPKPTKSQPFNVIKRSEESQRRKEARIKQILEEEKKKRQFHAKPAPKFLQPKSSTNTSSTSSQESNEENRTTIQNNFKARPALVLHKKPFVPVKNQHPLIEVQQFELSLDQRLKKREEFDKKVKENETAKKKMMQELEEEKRAREEEEINRLRHEAIVKANPIRKFKEFVLKASTKELVSPHTPKFASKIRK